MRQKHRLKVYAVNVLSPLMTLASLVFVGCVPNPEQLIRKIEAHARAAISTQIDSSISTVIELRVAGNPWGSGLLVYDANAADVDNVRLWLYYPDLAWTIPPRPKRNELFAFDTPTSKLTPAAPLLAVADDDVRREAGLTAIPASVVRETILRAITPDITIYEARGRTR